MVEDCLQCDVNESRLLLISPKHPSFATGWQSHLSAIYKAFLLHFQDRGVFFSVEVQVVKNPIREFLMAGGYSITTFLKLFSDPPRATVLAPPVLPDDETTTRGARKVILSILLLLGLLVPTNSTAIQGNVQAVQLPDNYKKFWLVLVSDGLLQMQLQAFKDMLNTSPYSFEKQYEMAQLLSKVLDQCVDLPGDLHGGAFHFLVVVSDLYYGGFIQPIETTLGWKWICGKDITQCYQQAAGLVTMILLEIEPQLYHAYLATIRLRR
jgi:hypothetical protein